MLIILVCIGTHPLSTWSQLPTVVPKFSHITFVAVIDDTANLLPIVKTNE